MEQAVVLSLRGTQNYVGQEPDVIELVTEGSLEELRNGWKLRYEESDLTGLSGVETTFLVEGKTITLTRTGRLRSQMVFQEGVPHDSLYRMEFGTLLLRVCATKVEADLSADGGVIDLKYAIEIENTSAGEINYHLDIQVKENA